MSSLGRHSGGSRTSKSDLAIRKYRPLVPASVSDTALHELIIKCESDIILEEEIQLLWDKEGANVEDEFCVVGKKSKKKEVPAPTRSDRGGVRGDRGSRGAGRPGAAVAGGAGRGGGRVAPAGARPLATDTRPIGAGERKSESPVDPLDPAGYPAVNPSASTSGGRSHGSGVRSMSGNQEDAPAVNSVWGGGSSLAQKIKTAEILKTEPPVVAVPLIIEDVVVLSASSPEAKPASKSRPRRERKGRAGPGKAETSADDNAAEEAPAVQEAAVSAKAEQTEVADVTVSVSEIAIEAPVAAAPVVLDHPVVSPAVEQVQEPAHVPVVTIVAPVEERVEHVPVVVAEEPTKKFVTLGKWATPDEPAEESGFQFGTFGLPSPSAAVQQEPAQVPVRTNRNQKSPGNKNASWKSGGDGGKRQSGGSNNANVANDSQRHSTPAPSWDTPTNDPVIVSSASDFNNPASTFINGNKGSAAPPGLSSSQGMESNKHQRGNRKSSGDSEQHNSGGKGQQQQQNAPPGMNQRAPAGANNGFGGIMPGGGMVPNMPYGTVPYDVGGGHQAPSLHHNAGQFLQPNYTGAAAALGSVPATSTPTVPVSGSSPTQGPAQSGAPAVTAGGAAAQHQGGYQNAPPGMPGYMPYSYNQPYYGHQFYYGAQPQGYYNNRGQPMYQQPPRNMYGGDGYGGSGAPGGYPDMYGSQTGQFGDSQYAGNTHHHGQGGGNSAERGNKQKNSSSANSSAAVPQQAGAGATDAHPHTGGYPGYGNSYPSRGDGSGGQQAQYPYQQGGWTPAPMMYQQQQSSPSGGGGFQGSGGRGGQHDNSSKSLNGPGYSGSAGSQYVAGNSRGSGSNAGVSSGGGASSQTASTAPVSNLQAGGW